MLEDTQGETAVVIGASMAGLLAARALADSFNAVWVIERDPLPRGAEARRSPRKGVPQGGQPHILLARGREAIEQLFPGFTQEMVALGGGLIDTTERIRWYQDGAFFKNYRSGLQQLMASRLAIEAVLRARVSRLANVHLIDNASVLGLVRDASLSAVRGVKIERRDQAGTQDGQQVEDLLAELVVDASGRGSRTPAWLEEMGFPRPQEERVEVKVTYASRYYERRPEDLNGDWGIVITPSAQRKSFAGLLAQEGSDGVPLRWMALLGGYFGQAPGLSEEEYLAYARDLPDPALYELIKDRPPLTAIQTYKFAASQRRRYEKLVRFPAGLLAFGDAIASFNPAYGQGMSVAALEALALQDCLRGGLDGLAARFFEKAAWLVDIPWNTAVGGDLQFPETQGQRTPLTRFFSWYLGRLNRAAHKDVSLSVAFQQVTNLIQPPQSLLTPAMMARVFWRNLT